MMKCLSSSPHTFSSSSRASFSTNRYQRLRSPRLLSRRRRTLSKLFVLCTLRCHCIVAVDSRITAATVAATNAAASKYSVIRPTHCLSICMWCSQQETSLLVPMLNTTYYFLLLLLLLPFVLPVCSKSSSSKHCCDTHTPLKQADKHPIPPAQVRPSSGNRSGKRARKEKGIFP